MKVLAIVVTYNRSPMLASCLNALEKQTRMCHVLVVDNASTDDTPVVLANWAAANHTSLRLEANLGGAGGFHMGMRWGVEQGYDYLWVMDDDTMPEPSALEALLAADHALGGQYGFLSSTALWTDGTPCRMNLQKPITKKNSPELTRLGLRAIKQATFVSCFFPCPIVRKYGLPIKEFFIWGDDVEYTRRIAVRNHEPCYWVRASKVIHAMATNNGSSLATDSAERIPRYNYTFRNENFLYRQEGMGGFLLYTARCLVHLLRIIFKAKSDRRRRMGVIVKQFFAGLRFNPRIEYVEE